MCVCTGQVSLLPTNDILPYMEVPDGASPILFLIQISYRCRSSVPSETKNGRKKQMHSAICIATEFLLWLHGTISIQTNLAFSRTSFPAAYKQETEDESTARDDRRAANGTGERLQRSVLLFLLGAPSVVRLQQIIIEEEMGQEEETEKRKGNKEKSWSELRKVLTDRINSTSVVAGLVVTYVTNRVTLMYFVLILSQLTTPPPVPHITRWDVEFPYCCMILGFEAAMLAIISGFAGIVGLSMIGPTDVKLVRERTYKYTVFLALLLSPFVFLLVASVCLGIALAGALWFGNVLWIKVLSYIHRVDSMQSHC
ncbi:hypothetical protein F5141DRAFT_1202516 [Pisolithus sp. B1]|nr:hypothetical protein F5141DRAFT_1202516 [Pisolithus sp. B1]